MFVDIRNNAFLLSGSTVRIIYVHCRLGVISLAKQ